MRGFVKKVYFQIPATARRGNEEKFTHFPPLSTITLSSAEFTIKLQTK